MLSGEGSDELFLGYPQHGLAPYLERSDAAKDRIRTAFHKLAPRVADSLWPARHGGYEYALRGLVSRAEETQLRRSALESAPRPDDRAEVRAHLATFGLITSHLPSLLHRNDRLGMAAGIENRFPFLGTDVVRLAMNLPVRAKLRYSRRLHDARHPFVTDKWAVRELAGRHLPPVLANRTKRGFPVRLQQRIHIDRSTFEDGFVQQAWRLTPPAIGSIVDEASATWLLRLLLVDVWGRMFVLGHDRAIVDEHVQRHVRLLE